MIRLIGYRYVTAALLLLAVLAVYGAAEFSRPAAVTVGQGRTVPVSAVTLACPAPAGGRVGALTVRTAGKDGRAQVVQTRDGAAVGELTTPGAAWFKDIDKADGSFTVRASGALAAGLEVEQTMVKAKGADRGLAATRCAEPGTDHWFLGPGPAAADHIEIHVSNVDDQPAAIDLQALSAEGPLDTVDGRGIAIAPHETKVIKLGDGPEGLGEIVKTAEMVALRVRTRAGRVSAAMWVRVADGKGVDWAPATRAPARQVFVPGVLGGGGLRRVLIAVPGQADARVRVQVVAPNGVFVPNGQESLLAPAGTVTPVDLNGALAGKAAGVRLTSDRPIVAGVVAERGQDVAYGAATEPIGPGQTGAVADNRLDTTLILSAPDAAATVRITPVLSDGRLGTPQEAKIGAGRTTEVKVTAPQGGGSGYGLLIGPLPGSGPVFAARMMSTKEQVTLLPVGPAPITVTLPPVGDSQTALVP